MIEYVLSYAKPCGGLKNNQVLLILKNKPAFQLGRYNLPGGKIDPPEFPEEAAIRELEEETGIKPYSSPILMGKIVGSWGLIYCFKIPVIRKEPIPRDGETEKPSWQEWHVMRRSPLLLPNLKVIIPLFMADVADWVIADEGPSWSNYTHSFSVNFAINERK